MHALAYSEVHRCFETSILTVPLTCFEDSERMFGFVFGFSR